MNTSYDLLTDPIPSLIRKLSIPASIGFLFNTLFNVVDTYFGGLISTEALAALSISFPVFFIVIAMSSGISTGTTALIANAIGSGKKKEANAYCAQAISFGLILAVIITLFGLWAAPSLFKLLGAEGLYLEIALEYMNVIFLGSVFFILANVLNAPLTATGDTKTFRNTLIIGSLLNIGLDPWFIFGGFGLPALGFKGLACSTVLIEGLSCIYLGYKAWQQGLIGKHTWNNLRPQFTLMSQLAKNIFPASVNMLTVGIGIFVITYYISGFGKVAVAAYGIATRIEQIALLPTIGLNMAALAISGQNFGAGHLSRIEDTLKGSIVFGCMIMVLGGVLVFTFAYELMGFFTPDTSVVEIGATYLKIAVFIFFAYVILFTTVSILQGMKKPMYAIWIGLYRQILAPLIFFNFLAHTLGWGLHGIWWGVFITTWSGAIFTLYYSRRIMHQHKVQTSKAS